MQVTQQVYVTEEWVQSANNKFDAESQSQREVEKALDTANHEKTQLAEKLKATESARQSVEAELKNAEAQAENQRKQLYTAQINLATEKAVVLDLKTELQKAHEALAMAKEAVKTAEVTVVCRDYCAKMYNKALDRAGVPTNSDLRRTDKVYYPEDIRKDPIALPPPAALPIPPPKQPLTTQDPS